MKKLLIPALALTLFTVPVGAAAADLVLRSIDISIGAGQPWRERKPDVVYVYGEKDRREHRHHRHWKNPRRQWREETRMIVIDRDSRRHCDSGRPGTMVVVADGRRR